MTCVSVPRARPWALALVMRATVFVGERLAGLVVPGKGAQKVGIFEELFEHLRRHFDEISFSGDADLARPALAAAKDLVHQVAELVEVGDNVGVLHKAGVVGGGLREIADQRGFGESAGRARRRPASTRKTTCSCLRGGACRGRCGRRVSVVGGAGASLSTTLKAFTPGAQTGASSARSKRTPKSLPAVARMPASTCSYGK